MPIIGRSAAAVASSCTDMLAGLSKWETCRIPPGVCAAAAPAATVAAKRKAMTANEHRLALVIYAASVRCPWERRGRAKAFPPTPVFTASGFIGALRKWRPMSASEVLGSGFPIRRDVLKDRTTWVQPPGRECAQRSRHFRLHG